MRRIGFLGAILLLGAVAGCTSSDTGSDRLSLVPQETPSSPDWSVSVGSAAHNDAYLNPTDPGDQQNNQGHGLPVGPDDPEYFAQFLRF